MFVHRKLWSCLTNCCFNTSEVCVCSCLLLTGCACYLMCKSGHLCVQTYFKNLLSQLFGDYLRASIFIRDQVFMCVRVCVFSAFTTAFLCVHLCECMCMHRGDKEANVWAVCASVCFRVCVPTATAAPLSTAITVNTLHLSSWTWDAPISSKYIKKNKKKTPQSISVHINQQMPFSLPSPRTSVGT